MRDPFTSGHQRRFAELAPAITQLLGWLDERVGEMQVAAFLHDVNKVVVPAEILAPVEFGVAVLASVFNAVGGYPGPQAYVDGMTAAVASPSASRMAPPDPTAA